MSRAELAMTFAASTVGWAKERLELTTGEIGSALGANARTIKRWQECLSVPSSTHRRQLERLNQLKYLLETSFRSPEAAQQWTHRPLPSLKGTTPLFAITEGELDEVISVLATLATGAHR